MHEIHDRAGNRGLGLRRRVNYPGVILLVGDRLRWGRREGPLVSPYHPLPDPSTTIFPENALFSDRSPFWQVGFSEVAFFGDLYNQFFKIFTFRDYFPDLTGISAPKICLNRPFWMKEWSGSLVPGRPMNRVGVIRDRSPTEKRGAPTERGPENGPPVHFCLP